MLFCGCVLKFTVRGCFVHLTQTTYCRYRLTQPERKFILKLLLLMPILMIIFSGFNEHFSLLNTKKPVKNLQNFIYDQTKQHANTFNLALLQQLPDWTPGAATAACRGPASSETYTFSLSLNTSRVSAESGMIILDPAWAPPYCSLYRPGQRGGMRSCQHGRRRTGRRPGHMMRLFSLCIHCRRTRRAQRSSLSLWV